MSNQKLLKNHAKNSNVKKIKIRKKKEYKNNRQNYKNYNIDLPVEIETFYVNYWMKNIAHLNVL